MYYSQCKSLSRLNSVVILTVLFEFFTFSIAFPVFNNKCNFTISHRVINLHCSHLADENELKPALQNLLEGNPINLELSHLNWDSVPLSSLHNISLYKFVVANSSFQSFLNDSFAYDRLQSVHQLALENLTFVEEPDWEDFSSFKKLKNLFIYNTTLQSNITSSFGHHLSKFIESATIAECNITDIEADSFRELKNLTHLRISHNKLKSFPRLVLTRSPKLEELRLDYNRIHFLPHGAFDNLPNLKVLSLSNNSISTLAEEVFSTLWRSDTCVELRDNPIKCDCRIRWAIESETKPAILVGRCVHPKSLYGKELKDLTVDDFNC